MGQTINVPSSVTEALNIGITVEQSEDLALEEELKEQAENIDMYFGKWDLPLTGYGMVFAKTAQKYDLDPYLLPAIAMRETTGGKFTCGGANPFGYGSCKIYFPTFEEAIDTVGKAISGNHEKIAYAYKGKNTKEILETYNPPSVVPTYAKEVMSIMNKISSIQESKTLAMK